MNSVFSVGLQPYISQGIISVLCCTVSLICGIIASVELFLALQNTMERELVSSKEFYILSSDIFKTLSIERQHRMLNGKIYLDNIHTKFCNLIDQCELIDKDESILKNVIENTRNKITNKLQNKIKDKIKDKKYKEYSNNLQNKITDFTENINIQLLEKNDNTIIEIQENTNSVDSNDDIQNIVKLNNNKNDESEKSDNTDNISNFLLQDSLNESENIENI